MTHPRNSISRTGEVIQSENSDNSPSEWHGCYNEGWTDITPESFSHPAKFSRSLIRRIYQHAIDQGWIKAGDWIVDPFAGCGLGSKDALWFGINWFGSELEPRFVDMGAGCDCAGISKADWVQFYGRWDRVNHKDGRHWCPQCLAQARLVVPPPPPPSPQLSFFTAEKADPGASYILGSGRIPSTQPHRYEGNLARFRKYARGGAVAVLVQGDSRKLAEIVKGRMAAMISSPPYGNNSKADYHKEERDSHDQGRGCFRGAYGHTEGQLAKLAEGDPDAIIGSPPYAGSRIAQEGGNDAANLRRSSSSGRYGSTGGQLGGMPDKGFSAVVGSPPYANVRVEKNSSGIDMAKNYESYKAAGGNMSFEAYCQVQDRHSQGYGSSEGQISALPAGDVEAIIGSPPYAGNSGGRGEASRNGIDPDLFERHSGGMVGGLGDNKNNLGNMKPGDFDAVLGSPPYIHSLDRGTVNKTSRVDLVRQQGVSNAEHISPIDMEKIGQRTQGDYGAVEGQLGAMTEGDADAVIGSPPYAGSNQDYKAGWGYINSSKGVHDRYSRQREADYGEQAGQLTTLPEGNVDAVVGSPPFGQAAQSGGTGIYDQLEQKHGRRFTDHSRRSYKTDQQGSTPGQLADLDEGSPDAIIGSSPYADQPVRTSRVDEATWTDGRPRSVGPSQRANTGYGQTPGQLGAMPAGLISSPPYGQDTVNSRNGIDITKFERYGANSQAITMNGYGSTPGQLNQISKETFWQAARTIVEQCYEVLKPGGVALWVCKDFVRDGARVPFCDQWRRLCEAVGFEHLETHRAMLVKHKGAQATLEGDLIELKSERKSFFRRLHESKPGAVRIDWEEVICLRKPVIDR